MNKVKVPFRPELADIEPYGAPQLDVPVRLNVNENPYAPSPEVIESVTQAVREAMTRLNRYADRDALDLRVALADYLRQESGVVTTADKIWAANGSNEIMLHLLQAFGGPGRVALGISPTYSMYHEYARDTSTSWVCLPELPTSGKLFRPLNVAQLLEGMTEHRPAVVFLPSPNNPTGTPIGLESIEQILVHAQDTGPLVGGAPTATLVVVDEAYGEFRPEGTPSALVLLDAYPNLVVTRTMSKAFAAAGLRLGYLVADPTIVHEVQKVRLPYHLSLLTQAAAKATLGHAAEQLAQVAQIRVARDQMFEWLREQGYEVAPSASNFLLFGPVEERERVWRELVDRGVLIRVVGPAGCLRVTIGTPHENAEFRQALVEVTK